MRPDVQHPQHREKKPPFPEREQPVPGATRDMKSKPDHGEESYVGKGRLVNKVALVTGADSGIGRAVAIAFAREGADIAISYLCEEDDANETKRWVEAAGRRAILLRGDLAEEASAAKAVDETVARFGRIDILVNNAAFQGEAVLDLDSLTHERVERTFRVNIVAFFDLVRRAARHMPEGSAIINVASIQAYDPSFPILDYAATKGAIVTFTKGLAQELIKRGIRVNCVAPGPVWTPLIVQSFKEEKIQRFGEQSPMERPAQPKELAPSFVFLACDESIYVNGEVLGVTGGRPLA